MANPQITIFFLILLVLSGSAGSFRCKSIRSTAKVSAFPALKLARSRFSSHLTQLGHRIIAMDAPTPEINPTRRDPDEPEPYIPIHLPNVNVGGSKMDVNSRLLQDRVVMIGDEVNDEMANVVVAQLLYLAQDNPHRPITMYINSPGGSISSGMAIFDVMQYIPCNVSTICFGMAASMGAFLLGEKLFGFVASKCLFTLCFFKLFSCRTCYLQKCFL